MTENTKFAVSNQINVIREKQEQYGIQKRLFVPYFERKDLTTKEKVEIGNYQDVHPWNVQKVDWSIPIPKEWEKKAYCYVINSSCRERTFFESLTQEEQEIVSECIQQIDSAIEKSNIETERFIYRGVREISWLGSPEVGTVYTEKAFGSFSLKSKDALKYTRSEKPIVFLLRVNENMKALYVDEAENEILRPREMTYVIEAIHYENFKIEKDLSIKAKVYTIKEIRRSSNAF